MQASRSISPIVELTAPGSIGRTRPNSGEVWVAGAHLDRMTENQLASWRESNLGVVLPFFRLLPTLTIEENIVLAMDFVGKVPAARRRHPVQSPARVPPRQCLPGREPGPAWPKS